VSDIHRVDGQILQGALTQVAENFNVLAGPYQAIQTEKVDLDGTMQLVELTRHLADWLVLDVPSTYDDLFFRSLTTADQIVLIADATVAGIRGAQMVCSSLEKRHPLVVINRYNPKSGLTVERIQGFLPGCDIFTLANDPAVVESTNNGQPLRLHSNRSPVLAGIEALIRKLDPDARTIGPNKSIIGRLARALSIS
jgi:pilus assembly protein CpaE